MANLYYVQAENEDGQDLSVFVRADTPEQAFEFWKDWDFSDETLFEDKLNAVPGWKAEIEDLRIFHIPDTAANGIIPWNVATGVECVAFAEEIE